MQKLLWRRLIVHCLAVVPMRCIGACRSPHALDLDEHLALFVQVAGGSGRDISVA